MKQSAPLPDLTDTRSDLAPAGADARSTVTAMPTGSDPEGEGVVSCVYLPWGLDHLAGMLGQATDGGGGIPTWALSSFGYPFVVWLWWQERKRAELAEQRERDATKEFTDRLLATVPELRRTAEVAGRNHNEGRQ